VNRSAFLAVLVGLFVCAFASTASEPEIAWESSEWNGVQRVFGVYAPAEMVDPAPIVFLLHGGGGSAEKTWNQEHGRSWRELSDAYGFLLVLPEGRADPDNPDGHHWNDCRVEIESEDVRSSEDDVGFIVALIDEVSRGLPIDRDRVYATGASNGGMMTYRLAIEAGEHFAAVAAVIANLPDPTECDTAPAPIPILIMNGTEDPLMPFDGGCVASDACERGRVLSTSETVTFWVDVNGASTTPDVEKLPNRSWSDGSRVTVYTFEGESAGNDVVYYRVQGGGHTVPGFESTSLLRRAVAGSKNRDIDGPTEIWAFFRGHLVDVSSN